MVRAKRAIDDAARKGDGSCAQALPKDLGDWQRTIEFTLGPFGCGKDLCRSLGAGFFAIRRARHRCVLPHRLWRDAGEARAKASRSQTATPVTRINWGGKSGVEVETARGKLTARAVIVTVSNAVLTAGRIKFTPDLPRRQLDAAAKLSLGSYDHIVLELPGNPLGLQRDELVFEKSEIARTGGVLANMSGSTLCMVDVARQIRARSGGAGRAGDGRVSRSTGLAGFTAPISRRPSSARRRRAGTPSRGRWAHSRRRRPARSPRAKS